MKHLNWRLDETRFLTSREVNRLREKTKSQSGKKADTRDWMIIDLALSTGLRLGEIAGLKYGDIMIQEGCSSLIVRYGKGGKSRIVRFGPDLKSHLQQFFSWKQGVGEEIGTESPLLISDRTGRALTRRAIQKAFARCAKRSGIHGHRFHDLRHTYASHLYKASKYNLISLQEAIDTSTPAGRLFYTMIAARATHPEPFVALLPYHNQMPKTAGDILPQVYQHVRRTPAQEAA